MAVYTTAGRPALHAPESCDGTCHRPQVPALGAAVVAYAFLLVAEMAPGHDARAIGGLVLAALCVAWTAGRAALRTAVLEAIARHLWRDARWLRLRLAARGLEHRRREDDRPVPGAVVVACHPRTGPPAAAARIGACA